MIYFINNEDDTHTKIGHSKNPKARLASLLSGTPENLRIYGTVPGGRNEELLLHSAFAPFRVNREWFNATEIYFAVVAILSANRAPQTVSGELIRRGGCRNGMTGLEVVPFGTGSVYTVIGTRWAAERGRLLLDLDEEGKQRDYWKVTKEEMLKGGAVCRKASWFSENTPLAPDMTVFAEECLNVGVWRSDCNCQEFFNDSTCVDMLNREP